MRRFLSEVLPAPGRAVLLGPAASHHLLRVTGIAPGERVVLFDGQGAHVVAELVGAEDGRALCRRVGASLPPPPPTPRLWLLCGLLKQGTFDQVVRQATELGVVAIVPVLAARSIPRGDRGPRWQRIAQAAAAQCTRADIPAVHPLQSLDQSLAALAPDLPRQICLPGAPPGHPLGPAGCAVLVGPEGGWTPSEVAAATAAGARPMGMGPRVLRADTAVVSALAQLTGLRT